MSTKFIDVIKLIDLFLFNYSDRLQLLDNYLKIGFVNLFGDLLRS